MQLGLRYLRRPLVAVNRARTSHSPRSHSVAERHTAICPEGVRLSSPPLVGVKLPRRTWSVTWVPEKGRVRKCSGKSSPVSKGASLQFTFECFWSRRLPRVPVHFSGFPVLYSSASTQSTFAFHPIIDARVTDYFSHISSRRYVSDLIKLKETFIDPLLHPYATSAPPFASDDPFFRATSPTESIEHLPIASRFLASPTPGQKPPGENVAGIGTVGYSRQRTASEGPRSANRMQDDAQSIGSAEEDGDDKLGRLGSSVPYLGGLKGAFKDRVRLGSGNSGKSPPMTGANSPYGKSGGKASGSARSSAAPVPSRSHQSLPPPSRNPAMQGATGSRQSLLEGSETIREGAATSMSIRTSDTRKWASSTTVGNTASKLFGNRKLSKVPPILEGSSSLLVSEGIEGLAVPTHLLPTDLRICLEVLEESLKGHMTLFEGLRKRYDEQYPLVRSLADVFVANVS